MKFLRSNIKKHSKTIVYINYQFTLTTTKKYKKSLNIDNIGYQ
jgi:hypothetical protein